MMVKFLRRFKYYISVKIVKVDCLYPYLIVSVFKMDNFRSNTVMMVKFLRTSSTILVLKCIFKCLNAEFAFVRQN